MNYGASRCSRFLSERDVRRLETLFYVRIIFKRIPREPMGQTEPNLTRTQDINIRTQNSDFYSERVQTVRTDDQLVLTVLTTRKC